MKKLLNLWPFQQEILDQAKDKERFWFMVDMGLGKTGIACKWAEINENNNIVFVICPKTLKEQWAKAITNKWLGDDWNVVVIKGYGDVNQIINKSLNANKRNIFITSFGRIPKDTLFLHGEPTTIIVDESQYIKDPTSKRSKDTLKFISKFKRAALLTGDPISNDLLGLYNQMKALGLYPGYYRDFQYEFFFMIPDQYAGREMPSSPRPHMMERIKSRYLKDNAVIIKTEDVHELPDQVWSDITIKINKHYKFVAKHHTLNDWASNSPKSLQIMLRRLCSGHDGEQTLHKDKLNALQDICKSTDRKIIVWYQWDYTRQSIQDNLKDRKIFLINGQNNQKDEFVKYKGSSILLCQYQSAAEGTDGLQEVSNTAVYYEPTDRGGLYKQSIKRIHRIGQKDTAFYYRLKVDGSVEDDVYAVVEQGRDFTDQIFERKYMNEKEKEIMLDKVQEASQESTGEDKGYMKNPLYLELKSMKKPELILLAKDLGVPGIKVSIKKGDLIREIIEHDEMEHTQLEANSTEVELVSEESFGEVILEDDSEVITPEVVEEVVEESTDEEPDAKICLVDDAVLDQGLKIFSQSKISTFRNNPRDYKHKYIDKLRTMDNPPYFLLGSVMHAMIEHNGDVGKVLKLMDLENKDYQEEDRDFIIQQGVMLGKAALQGFQFDEGDHEVEFLVEMDKNNALYGFIDQVYINKNGEIGIGEWKTASNANSIKHKLNYAFQAHLYAWAFWKATGIKPVEFVYRVVVKPKIKQTQKEDEQEYFNRYLAKALETDDRGKYKNLHEFKIHLKWDRVIETFEGALETVTQINNSKVFPINDFTANLYGEWDYNLLYDPMITNAEQYYKKPKK